jgi:hypothetical protein
MKKTIAILLVLVIGMAGVFAAVADEAILNLVTSVSAFDEIKLSEEETYTWGTVGEVTDANNDLGPITVTTWDNTTTDSYQNVAYVHARSNRRGGFKVSATATALSMSEGESGSEQSYYIGYKINAGNVAALSVAADDTTTTVGDIFSITTNNGTHFNTGSELIQVAPLGKTADYRVGDYSATITFIVEAN